MCTLIFSHLCYLNFTLHFLYVQHKTTEREETLPANTDANAAIAIDNTTAGPASYFDIDPARTYVPTPRVAPTPSAVRSNVPRHLFRVLGADKSINFLRVSFSKNMS